MVKAFAPAAVYLSLSVGSTAAFAQTLQPIALDAQSTLPPSTSNTIVLRNGMTVRGQITEIRAGEFITVTSPEGARTLAWSDIVHAEGPSFPGGYNGSTFVAAPVAPPVDYRHPGLDRAPLVVESAGPPQEVGEAAVFMGPAHPVAQHLCTTPCTLYVPATFTLQSRAPGLRGNYVSLVVPSSGLHIRLRAATRGGYYGGVAAVGGGGFLMATGVGLAIYGAMLAAILSSSPYPSSPSPVGFYEVGGTLIGVGAAALLVGAILMVANRSGLEGSRPLAADAPQLSFGVTPDGAAASMSMRF